MVLAKQRQLANHTSELSEETSRDGGVDIYTDVEEISQNTSFAA